MAYRRSALESRVVELRFDGGKRGATSAPKMDYDAEPENGPEDDVVEYEVHPPECPSADHVRMQLEGPDWEAAEQPKNDTEKFELRFTLKQLMVAVLLASILFSGLHWLPPVAYAGFAGLIALLGLVVLATVNPASPTPYFIWWVVLGVYLIASTIAAFARG